MRDEQRCRLDDPNASTEDETIGKREMGAWFPGQGHVKNYPLSGSFQFKVIWVNPGKPSDQVARDLI